jgi:hypothetical protein
MIMKITDVYSKDKVAQKYYWELQLIDEFHADFHPTLDSELRKAELITLINKLK